MTEPASPLSEAIALLTLLIGVLDQADADAVVGRFMASPDAPDSTILIGGLAELCARLLNIIKEKTGAGAEAEATLRHIAAAAAQEE